MGGTVKGRAEKRPVVRVYSERSLAVVGPRSRSPRPSSVLHRGSPFTAWQVTPVRCRSPCPAW